MPGVLLRCLVFQAHRGASLTGVLLCSLAHQSLKEHPGWVLLYGSVHHASDGPASLFSCWQVGREALVVAPPPMHDSAVSPCFHGCLAFLHRYFPPRSPPSQPLNPSLCSQRLPLPWDCPTIPKLQLPAAAPSRRPAFLSEVCMDVTRTV